MDRKLELAPVTVSDMDSAITFHRDKVGFVLDVDQRVDPELRFVQLTRRGLGVDEVQDLPWGRFVFFSDPKAIPGRCSRSRPGIDTGPID